MKSFGRVFLIIPFIFSLIVSAQENNNDSSSLLQAFKKGKTDGRLRMYYMSTNNEDTLTDYYALAFGGGLNFQTRSFKGFQLGIGGFFIWNISSSDLTKTDPITNTINRYEIGQFDQEDLSNRKNMQRLEDFYIRYNFKNSFIRYGKQVLKTPFINPQDGRMRPTGQQGIWAEISELKKTKMELGWLTHISPRGTVKWHSGASSIGIYPSGVSINGIKSNYKHNLHSDGIAIAGITFKPDKTITIQLWDHWVENIFNTVSLQADAEFEIDKNKKIISGLQLIHQAAVNDGGNPDASKAYFDPSQKSNILSTRLGIKFDQLTTNLNYSRISGDGRFLFPREWGREPLYTFLPRERNEGYGDVNAISLNLIKEFPKQNLKLDLSAGYYDLPSVKNYNLNKYGFPSYYQLNLDVRYTFGSFLQGLNAELLYLYKKERGNTYNDPKNVINKVNMHQLNLILNFIF